MLKFVIVLQSRENSGGSWWIWIETKDCDFRRLKIWDVRLKRYVLPNINNTTQCYVMTKTKMAFFPVTRIDKQSESWEECWQYFFKTHEVWILSFPRWIQESTWDSERGWREGWGRRWYICQGSLLPPSLKQSLVTLLLRVMVTYWWRLKGKPELGWSESVIPQGQKTNYTSSVPPGHMYLLIYFLFQVEKNFRTMLTRLPGQILVARHKTRQN